MEADEDRPDCPSWCLTTAEEHAEDDPGTWLHEGPRFGLLRTWWLEGATNAFTATVEDAEEGVELAADDLRQLATDALDAAIWLDRQARTSPAEHGVSVVELVRRAHERSTRSA
ncbi:hypothetical protein [Pimelobacter simplex]|uniref:hypothetical protein n=1 Tax=Nocardioides simplex TaxID=2045 RepID=UPI0019311D6F|nr:hypothetical protein [Pimelobacter simplex]